VGDVLGLRIVWLPSLMLLQCLLLPTYLQGAMISVLVSLALCLQPLIMGVQPQVWALMWWLVRMSLSTILKYAPFLALVSWITVV
jgi:hypothetical protein